ncbi:hypothetical protein EDC56_1102 [Sinobacterium caligoides]|uniref:Signal transducing protein n=1 Tax=Sinobacterium caligoides TaxID=933926 RepID=A0A3N2E1X1_9GAMM|nr:hypothetical protein [Sinobacterium caligoides]ROS05565.1 hypothetical protein EDC56_1102 [Sinobacterium caligoides]
MKILFHTTEKTEATNIKLRFELAGIPVFIGSEDTGPALGFVYANKYTVWVCLDHQHEDAVLLLKDEAHEVTTAIDVSGYYQYIEDEQKKSANKNYDRIMLAVVLSCVGIFIAWAYQQGVFTQ